MNLTHFAVLWECSDKFRRASQFVPLEPYPETHSGHIIFEPIKEKLTLEFYENEDESVKQNLRIYILDVLDKNVYSEI